MAKGSAMCGLRSAVSCVHKYNNLLLLLLYIIIVASFSRRAQYRTSRNGESLYWNWHYLLWGNRLAVVTLARVNTDTVRMLRLRLMIREKK